MAEIDSWVKRKNFKSPLTHKERLLTISTMKHVAQIRLKNV
jgi:hypothetical protein